MTTTTAYAGGMSPSPAQPSAAADIGPSTEMRRFSAGIRLVTALLCTLLLRTFDPALGPAPMAALLAYGLFAALLLWREATGAARQSPAWPYWVDVGWAIGMLALAPAGTMMLLLTLVHPVVLITIGYGVHRGLLLALAAAFGIAASGGGVLFSVPEGWAGRLPALMVLALVPAAALIALPMSRLRRHRAMVDLFEAQLDPRRGLAGTCTELAERLRAATQADLAALVLPAEQQAPAVLASRAEGAFPLRGDAHDRLESLLARLPARPASYMHRPWWDPRWELRVDGSAPVPADLPRLMAAVAAELEVQTLHVVPLSRYGHRHGHCLIGHARDSDDTWDAAALAAVAPDLLRIVEQAGLVDQLQAETEGHERARIGRDLHDSAIQPYLGLKYAVETVALRIPADNPARAEVDSLAALVNGEVASLRELISTLRTGAGTGDNALVPAVRRQVRRFAVLFGIDIDLDCPEHLPTTRALAGALFHLVNEALNNVRKHTLARHAWVRLALEAGAVQLTVRDDAGAVHGHPVADFHPRSLDERVRELGGTLQIARPDGVNTELRITIPV